MYVMLLDLEMSKEHRGLKRPSVLFASLCKLNIHTNILCYPKINFRGDL
jgi:hypothetical protein